MFHQASFWWAPTHADIVDYFMVEVWQQNCARFFDDFKFERSYDVLKSKSPCILFSKNISLNKNEAESKFENLTHNLREMNLGVQLI